MFKDSQAHFSNNNSHFYLNYKVNNKPKKEKQPKLDKGKKNFFTTTSKLKKGILTNKVNYIRDQYKTRSFLFNNKQYYFIIIFSDILKNTFINKTLENLNGKVVSL